MMSKLNISWSWVFVFFTFLKPAGFDMMGYSAINSFLNVARIVCALIIVVSYLGKKKKNKFLPYLLLYLSVCFIATYFGIGNMYSLFIFAGSIISFALIWDIIPAYRIKVVLRSLLLVYMALIVFSLWWMYSYVGFTINIEEHFSETELQHAYFLSSSNGSGSTFIAGMVVANLNLYISGKKSLLSWITLFATFISGLIIWSATSLVAEVALLGYAICYYFGWTRLFMKYIKHRVLLYVSLFISIGITFFNIQYLFEFLIVDVLHKDLTMTGRTTVWFNGFNAFLTSPFLGLGNGNDIVRTCDNCYAQVLGDTGALGMFAFSVLMFVSYRLLKKNRLDDISYLFFITYDLLLLMFVSESWCQFFGLYVLLVLFSKTSTIQKYVANICK